jgi:DNA-binding MarR family transcriptional regulator
MARPWRIEYEGALYHVFSRGNNRYHSLLRTQKANLSRNMQRFGTTYGKMFIMDSLRNSPRVSESDKLNRDILLYLLWQEGKYTNIQIGNLLGLTHSAVSRRVTIIRKKMAQELNFRRQVKALKSQIKP